MINIDFNCKSKYEEFLLCCRRTGVILFGASNYGRIVYTQLKSMDIIVEAFVDNDINKVGNIIEGVKVISVEELTQEDKEKRIMITSTYFSPIYEQLISLGFKNIMHRNLDLEKKLFYDKKIIEMNMKNIEEVYNILADDKSKEIMMGLINHRLTNDFSSIIYEGDQYFVEDIIKLSEEEVFIDGGAYIGDTIQQFIMKNTSKFEKIYAFEPDSKNIDGLNKFVYENKINSKVIIEEAGLYNKTGVMKFDFVSETGSYISEKGTETIRTEKIDDYFKDIPVTFIKMDIEGAEKEALCGGEETIKRNKPKLAICIYHEPSDLWEIPLLIKKIMPEYNIYIRHHRNDLYETVCYAVMK